MRPIVIAKVTTRCRPAMVPKRKTRRAEVTKKLRSAVDDTRSTIPPANVVNTSSREEGCEETKRENGTPSPYNTLQFLRGQKKVQLKRAALETGIFRRIVNVVNVEYEL